MEFKTHKSVGINMNNVSEVYAFQRLVLGIETPILINNGRNPSRVGYKRRKNLDPQKVLLQYIVHENEVLGVVDDYDHDDPDNSWRIVWQDGQITLKSFNFPDETLYGSPGNCLIFKCSKPHLLDCSMIAWESTLAPQLPPVRHSHRTLKTAIRSQRDRFSMYGSPRCQCDKLRHNLFWIWCALAEISKAKHCFGIVPNAHPVARAAGLSSPPPPLLVHIHL